MPRKRQKVLLSWSGGKDSSIALFELKSPQFEIVGLISSFVGDEKRLQMHEVSMELIEAQAQSLELPLYKIELPEKPTNEVYEKAWREKLDQLQSEIGVEAVAFGDIHLEDIRKYREKLVKSVGLKAVFPLWAWQDQLVVNAFGGLNHSGIVHCIEDGKLPEAFLGREYNASFVEDLPMGVSPIGENGEFHSFIYDGPFMQQRLPLQTGEKYQKDGFHYLRLSLAQDSAQSRN